MYVTARRVTESFVKGAMTLGLLLILSACVTAAPQSIGQDTYMVETMGTNMTVQPALNKATAFCAKQSKKVLLLTTNRAGVLLGANTSITFMCLDPDDPRYTTPVMHNE